MKNQAKAALAKACKYANTNFEKRKHKLLKLEIQGCDCNRERKHRLANIQTDTEKMESCRSLTEVFS